MITICDGQARVAAATTIAVMLEGPVRAFLQVAEYRELAQRAPFTTLSGTLGQIVIQLHTGTLHCCPRFFLSFGWCMEQFWMLLNGWASKFKHVRLPSPMWLFRKIVCPAYLMCANYICWSGPKAHWHDFLLKFITWMVHRSRTCCIEWEAQWHACRCPEGAVSSSGRSTVSLPC